MILLTVLGFLLFFGSVALGYTYLQKIEAGSNAWYLLVLTILCVILSALSMLQAGRSKNIYANTPQQTTAENDPSIATSGLQNALEKHNELVSAWRKTARMKDKMTMIKVSTPTQKPRM